MHMLKRSGSLGTRLALSCMRLKVIIMLCILGSQVENHIYETPTNLHFSPDKVQNETDLEPQPQLHALPTGLEMKPCPAYQTFPSQIDLGLNKSN